MEKFYVQGNKRSSSRRLRFLRFLQRNDIVLRVGVSFALVMSLFGVVIGVVFMLLHRQVYLRSTTETLTRQGEIIADRVEKFARNNNVSGFERYGAYVDEWELAENTDVWILSNESSAAALSADFVNAEAGEDFTEQMLSALALSFAGDAASFSGFDRVYGMTTLVVSVPIADRDSGVVSGAVMLVSMIDRQTLGLREGYFMILFSVLAALILSYIASVFFSRFLTVPLHQLGGHIGALAAKDYTPKKVKRPFSQIGGLEKSLNKLGADLSRAKRERETADQARSDFFANISHELRTPITVLSGFTETLADGMVTDPKEVERMYRRILSECKNLDRLVGDLFLLSKLQNADFQMDVEPVSLAQVFADVEKSGSMLGKEKKVTLKLSVPEDDPCLVLGDYGRLRQLFLIIVDNAVKFSREGGQVEISVEKQGEEFAVCIRDYGVGIAPEQLLSIFEKFTTSKMRQNKEGTGLGLMIAKQIAERHNANIRAESTLGEGTAFFFTFSACTSTKDFE